ncbi:metal ABC transporter substrate-binding protein [Natronorubrum aibiense]|uniref:Zinc ABC transporter substrate-binding protein n=1 Tax=Natronorubrum aibiense TaxID=348826 RepID=A0A5P9P5Z9_9EURY|nr:zinc ABC transporter substrate-binding protein [Natronorubrum aibiense]QFU83558.1 zinc ABC transporter substrate-binding protein [Natronorubrum aibiense]
MDLTRRTLVKATAGVVATGGIAGCLDDVSSADVGLDSGYAAFFTLWDWAEQVSGDEIEFENPVGTGEAGHGWSPSGDLTREIADSGAFIYLDTPEFSWAQDIAATLESDYDAVAVIDGLEGLDDQLLGWDHEVDTAEHDHEEDDHSHDDDHSHENDSHDDHDHDDDHNHENDSHDDHDHDESSADPHVWLDPVLAQDIVDTIATGLADADPDNADTYEENAAAYRSELESLDERFEELVADADQQTVVFAGHDSFTYLQDRYGFEIHTPIGVSPQEDVSSSAISETIDLVDEEGIDTVLYDPFEAPEGQYPPLVETLLESSAATDAMELTHMSGTLSTWADNDWGYREQMEEINLPAFREALNAQ